VTATQAYGGILSHSKFIKSLWKSNELLYCLYLNNHQVNLTDTCLIFTSALKRFRIDSCQITAGLFSVVRFCVAKATKTFFC